MLLVYTYLKKAQTILFFLLLITIREGKLYINEQNKYIEFEKIKA